MTDVRSTAADRLLRILATGLHLLLKAGSFVRRPRTFGAHALALTPDRRVILVKLRYAPGWRFPGGGRDENEAAQEAVVRELREEIGMVSHGRIRRACELEDVVGFKRDLASLLIVENVRYQPRRWSWEVEAVRECPLDDLPPDMSPRASKWLEAVRARL